MRVSELRQILEKMDGDLEVATCKNDDLITSHIDGFHVGKLIDGIPSYKGTPTLILRSKTANFSEFVHKDFRVTLTPVLVFTGYEVSTYILESLEQVGWCGTLEQANLEMKKEIERNMP